MPAAPSCRALKGMTRKPRPQKFERELASEDRRLTCRAPKCATQALSAHELHTARPCPGRPLLRPETPSWSLPRHAEHSPVSSHNGRRSARLLSESGNPDQSATEVKLPARN